MLRTASAKGTCGPLGCSGAGLAWPVAAAFKLFQGTRNLPPAILVWCLRRRRRPPRLEAGNAGQLPPHLNLDDAPRADPQGPAPSLWALPGGGARTKKPDKEKR